jgi:hypothetical protein
MAGKELKTLEPLRSLLSYTPEEKQKIFDDLHTQAKAVFEHAIETGRYPPEAEHFAFESMMELLGPSVWPILKKATDE